MCVCMYTSSLAIFMDRFSNQGYLWNPHDPGMTKKYEITKFRKSEKFFEKFSSLNASSLPECLLEQGAAASGLKLDKTYIGFASLSRVHLNVPCLKINLCDQILWKCVLNLKTFYSIKMQS